MHVLDAQREFRHRPYPYEFDDIANGKMRGCGNGYEEPSLGNAITRDDVKGTIVDRARLRMPNANGGEMQREYPEAPLVAVGAVVVNRGRVLLVRRGSEPLKGHWSLPGGMLEVGESLSEGVVREVREETGLTVQPVELVELLDRIHRDGERVRYHYVIADYLCRVVSGELKEASDADAVRWVERAEWNSDSALKLDPVTVRVIEAGWQKARSNEKGSEGR